MSQQQFTIATLLRLDFAQMLFDGGWAVALKQALADAQTRGWLRSDDALRLSLDLGLRHFTRLKLLASLGCGRGAGLMRNGMRQDIYPKLADSEAGEWMEGYERMLMRWICPLPGVAVGGRAGEEPPLWVPPPEHRWEEMLMEVSSLAEKIRRQVGERAMFRGMNFWFTQLHQLDRWPAGWDELRKLCAEAWQRDDMESNRVFTYADYFGSVLSAQMAREFGGWLRFTVRPEWKPAAYDRDGVADWMEDHLYGRLHASLAALTSSRTGDILRRAATAPDSVTDEELTFAFRILRHYTVVHAMGHLGETFGTMVLKQQLAGKVDDDVCFIPGQAIWVEGEDGRKQGPDALLARVHRQQDGRVKLEVVGIVEKKAYRVSATRLLEQIHQHEQRMTAGKVTLLTLTPPNGEAVWHGRAEMNADGAISEITVTELSWSADLRRIAVLPAAKRAAKAPHPSQEVIEMPWTPTGFRRMGWRVLAWYGENLGRTADPNDYELGRTSWINCVERLLRSPKAAAATGRFLPQLLDTLQSTGRDPDEDAVGWAWSEQAPLQR